MEKGNFKNLICQNPMSQNYQISAFCLQTLWKINQDKKLETCLSIKKIGRFQFSSQRYFNFFWLTI